MTNSNDGRGDDSAVVVNRDFSRIERPRVIGTERGNTRLVIVMMQTAWERRSKVGARAGPLDVAIDRQRGQLRLEIE